MNGIATFATLLSTTLILMIYSILYRENPAFKLAENIMVGATVGHAIVMAVFQVRDLAIQKLMSGIETGNLRNIAYIIPIILGILIYFQFSRRFRVISRPSIALMLGVGLALSMRGLLFVNVIGQIQGVIKPLISIQSIVSLFGLVCVLLYFVYEKKVSDAVGPLPTIGRYFLMLTMGAYIANSLMGRLSIVIGTLQTLIPPPAWYLIPIALILVIVDAIFLSKRHL